MRILIDFTQIPKNNKAGVGVYAVNILQEFILSDGEFCCYVLMQDDDLSFSEVNLPKVKFIYVNSWLFRSFFFRVLLEQFYIPYLVRKHSIDAVHSLHYSFPLFTSARKIVTVHDLTFFIYPELHQRLKVIYFKFFINMLPRYADKIICVSESTKKDFISRFNLKNNKAVTVPHGCSPSFAASVTDASILAVKYKYGILGEYILFIGTIEPRKNIVSIIKAFMRLRDEGKDYKLVISGRKGWHYGEVFELVVELGLSDFVIFTGFIDEAEKAPLLAGSKLFVYPSLYEGFGIPVLEALACGVPTITSSTSSMPEVAGEAALLVDPEKSDEIFDAMLRIFQDSDLVSELKLKSRLQASKFTWENSARMTIEIYHDCTNK